MPQQRRDALLELLQQCSTAPLLAARLNVSERTVQRDVAQLRAAGHRIAGSKGQGGGLLLRPARRSP